jgi:hypothetical protein
MFRRSNIETTQHENAQTTANTAYIVVQDNTQNELTDQMSQLNIYGDKPEAFYASIENELVFDKYGAEIYNYIIELDEDSIGADILKRHKLDSHSRTKMIDWMVEVLYAFNSEPQTFFYAVHIMDLFISKTSHEIANSDIHLIGIVCIYIASKMEDIIPLRMSNVIKHLGHNKFEESQVKNLQKMILETIEFEIICTSAYDFIKSYFYDCYYNNNKEFANIPDMKMFLDRLESTAIYLAKLMAHSEEFSSYK